MVPIVMSVGCFRYMPVTSLDDINDARVQVIEPTHTTFLTHATADGTTITGLVDGESTVIELSHGDHVRSERLDTAATAGLIVGGVVITAAALIGAFLLALAAQPRPVFEGFR